jgi:hypothetical protein
MASKELLPVKRQTPLPENRTDIRWQVAEWQFGRLPNLYAAVPMMIDGINTMIREHPDPDDLWLFQPKDDEAPTIKFMVYENTVSRKTEALVYDTAFTIRVFSVGSGAFLAIPMGSTDRYIYSAYWMAKLDSQTIPPIPKDILQGWLKPDGDGFTLESIFLGSAECGQLYELALNAPGFSMREYEKIDTLVLCGLDYFTSEVTRMVKKHPKLPEDTLSKLYEHYLKRNFSNST